MRRSPVLALGLLLAFVGLDSPARADLGWSPVSERNGIRVERRSVSGSAFYEFRASAHTQFPPALIATALWADRADGKFSQRYRKKHVVLEETGTERLVYEQINTPVVSDREYVVRLRRGALEGGAFRLDFHMEGGGPSDPNCVRAGGIRGAWTVRPGSQGGSEVVYTVFTDPGGAIPAFLVHQTQADSTRDVLAEVLDWAAAHGDHAR